MPLFGREYDYSLIRTSSKEAMLRSALMVTNNDIKRAAEICDYFTKQLPNMPEREPEPPTVLNQLDGISDWLAAWGEKHPDISNGIGNMLMAALKNTKFGAFLQPAAEVTVEMPPAPPIR